MIHYAKLCVRGLAYTPWLLVAGLVLGWAGAAMAQQPTVSVNNTAAIEGQAMVFDMYLNGVPASEATVDYSLSAPGANPADLTNDLTSVRGTLTFGPTVTVLQVTVQTTDDAIDEVNETFTLTLSNPQGLTLDADPTATGTIYDNDLPPTLSIADATATEGSGVGFVVTLSAQSEKTVTVRATPSVANPAVDGSAVAADFTALAAGTLTFSPGSTTQRVVVQTTDDAPDEPDETFTVTLSGATNATLADDTATGTILDNDPLPSLSIAFNNLADGLNEADHANAPQTYHVTATVTRTGATNREVVVSFTVGEDPDDDTENADFHEIDPASRTLTFGGSVSADIKIKLADDLIGEEDEYFTVRLKDPTNAVLGVAAATARINRDNDPAVLTVADTSASESGPVKFTVEMSAARDYAVTVDYAASIGNDDTATAADLTLASGTLTIKTGDKSGAVSVPIVDDGIGEADETFTLRLSNPQGISADGVTAQNPTLGNSTATGTILDDDAPAAFNVADVSAIEGDTLAFVVSASSGSLAAMTVAYEIKLGQVGAGFHTAGPNDFTNLDAVQKGTLTFAANATGNELKQTVKLVTRDDSDDEANENCTLELSKPTIADPALPKPTIADGSAVGTILDDDDPPSLNVADAWAAEGDTLKFVVTLALNSTEARSEAVTVDYATSYGTATSADFTEAKGTLTFAASDTEKTVAVVTTEDAVREGNETFTLALSSPSANATIGTATATGTIFDDDGTPTLSVADARATEGDTLKFAVALSPVSSEAVTVDYETVILAGNSASANDLTLGSGTLTFAAGAGLATVAVATTQDVFRERDETFTLRLLNASATATIGTATATGTIVDDEDYPVFGQISLTVSPTRVREDAETTAAVSVVAAVQSPPDAATTIALTLSGTASQGTDYTVSGTQSITIPAGALSAKTELAFRPINDDADEGSETIYIVGSAAGYTSGSTTLTLTDDDKSSPPVSSGGGGGGGAPLPPPPAPSFDNEAIAAQFYIQDMAIDRLVFPVAQDGGKPLTYALSQTGTAQAGIDSLTGLPDSLAFDPKTRTLAGTPATPLPAAEFSYTVIDAYGRTASLCFDITIYALVGPPTPPTDLTVAFDDAGNLVLRWQEPARNGGYDLVSYEVQYQKTTSASWRRLAVQVPANYHTKTYIIGGLQADADYNVRIRAYNLNPRPDLSVGEWAMASTDETAMPDEIAAGTGAPAADGAVCKPGVGDLLTDNGDDESSGDGDAGEPTVPSAPGAPANLTATPGDGRLSLSWEEPAQTGGFDLTFYDLQYQKTTSASWISILRIPANYRTKTYSIGGLQNGVAYNVRVRVHNLNPDPELSLSAWTTVTAIPSEDVAAKQVASIPASFELAAAYPNPFNPSTTISYALPQAADVRLDIYNVMGQRVRTLVAADQPAGYYAVEWQATDDSGHTLSSGVYFYRLQAGAFRATKRMLLMR